MSADVKVKPSIGRIMIYQHPGSSDNHYPPTQSPALVHKVHEDGTVDAWVFGPLGFHKDNKLEVGEPGEFRKLSWPPRV